MYNVQALYMYTNLILLRIDQVKLTFLNTIRINTPKEISVVVVYSLSLLLRRISKIILITRNRDCNHEI